MARLDASMIRRASLPARPSAPRASATAAAVGWTPPGLLREGEARQFLTSFAACFVVMMAFLA